MFSFSISIGFSCSFFFTTLHNLKAGYRNIKLKEKSIIACFSSEIEVTAFHTHCLSML